MGVRFDTDGHAHQHVGDDTAFAGDHVEPIDLDHRVEDDVPDPGVDRSAQLVDALVVAVQCDSLRRETGAQCDGEFTTAADVQGQPLVVDPARDLGTQERLRRVVHSPVRAERRHHVPAARPEVGLVHDERRRPELFGELTHRHAGQPQLARFVAGCVARPHLCGDGGEHRRVVRTLGEMGCGQQFGVPGAGGVCVHICSGAVTPTSPRPLAKT